MEGNRLRFQLLLGCHKQHFIGIVTTELSALRSPCPTLSLMLLLKSIYLVSLGFDLLHQSS